MSLNEIENTCQHLCDTAYVVLKYVYLALGEGVRNASTQSLEIQPKKLEKEV